MYIKNRRIRLLPAALILLAVFILYEVIGALAPFVSPKTVNAEFQSSFSVADFYSEEFGPDYASVVESNVDALDLRIRMIQQAKEQIVLSTFDIRDGKSSDDIFAALIAAANRGVKIKVLVDGLYGTLHMSGKSVYYAAGRHENIEIRFYNLPNLLKPWTINGRMHDKYLLVDDSMLLLGGRNTFDYFLGDYTDKNVSYDREVMVYNSAAGTESRDSVIFAVYDYFLALWDMDVCRTVFDDPSKNQDKNADAAAAELAVLYETMQEEHPERFLDIDYRAELLPVNKISLISNPTNILAKEPAVWYQSKELMAAAKQRVFIHTPYAVLDHAMYTDLEQINKNVPDVSMLVNAVAVGDNFMASSDYFRNRPKILKTGVDLYEFFGDYSSHGKSILIDDDLSLVGSYNVDLRSTYVDTETMLVIHGKEFNAQLEKCIFDLKEQSLKVTDEETYEPDPQVEEVELSFGKNLLFELTSRLFQLFRYLI